LSLAAFPEDERREVGNVERLLFNLSEYESRYADAWALYAHSLEVSGELTPEAHRNAPFSPNWIAARQERKTALAWGEIALRDAAFSIFHFFHTLDGIVIGGRTLPTLRAMVDLGSLNAAQPMLRSRFPEPALIRNAIGHEAEFSKTADKTEKHRVTMQGPNGGSVQMRSVIVNSGTEVDLGFRIASKERTHTGVALYQAIEGKMVKGELSPEGMACLREVANAVYAAFLPAEKESRRKVCEEFARSMGLPYPPEGQ